MTTLHRVLEGTCMRDLQWSASWEKKITILERKSNKSSFEALSKYEEMIEHNSVQIEHLWSCKSVLELYQ